MDRRGYLTYPFTFHKHSAIVGPLLHHWLLPHYFSTSPGMVGLQQASVLNSHVMLCYHLLYTYASSIRQSLHLICRPLVLPHWPHQVVKWILGWLSNFQGHATLQREMYTLHAQMATLGTSTIFFMCTHLPFIPSLNLVDVLKFFQVSKALNLAFWLFFFSLRNYNSTYILPQLLSSD